MRNSIFLSAILLLLSCHTTEETKEKSPTPRFKLIPSEKFLFKSFVDCNMAEAWIGDTLRIFAGKYGEDPVWGDAEELEYASGGNADEVFLTPTELFTDPVMPLNAKPGENGLHGAIWFETVYQSAKDPAGKTLYAIYHNENYPATLPYNAATGEGYIDTLWPEGLTGVQSPAAVCRIGVMKSTDGGHSWENKGLFIEDLQPRMVLRPHNNALTFAGGVGDPSAVASGEYLYLFYGEYSYPGSYEAGNYDSGFEATGQCISVARIRIADLDNPLGKAKRWNGQSFDGAYNGVGKPIQSLQIPASEKGGAACRAGGNFHWGPSVSWNEYLQCWVMMMGRVEGTKWIGDKIYISFNTNKDLGIADHAQQWTKPQLLLQKPGHILWYPALQPLNTAEDIKGRRTCLKLGKQARLFVKDMEGPKAEYISEYIIEFE